MILQVDDHYIMKKGEDFTIDAAESLVKVNTYA